MYIVFEGIDGVGKSTQVQMMKDVLNNERTKVVKEPYDYDSVKNNIKIHKNVSNMYEYLLFMADRCLLHDTIKNESNIEMIISDRSIISGFAYNRTKAKIEDMLDVLGDTIPLPNLIIFMQISRKSLEQRLNDRDGELDEIESRGIDYLMNIQSNMRKIINEHFEPKCNILYLDADGDINELHKIINGRINSIVQSGTIVDMDSLFKRK